MCGRTLVVRRQFSSVILPFPKDGPRPSWFSPIERASATGKFDLMERNWISAGETPNGAAIKDRGLGCAIPLAQSTGLNQYKLH